MPEKIIPGPLSSAYGFKEAVCINVDKIYDICKEKDCIEDLKVHFDCHAQEIIDEADCLKPKHAEVLWACLDLDDLPFDKGFYSVKIKYFFKVVLEVASCGTKPKDVTGYCTFCKKVILYGGVGNSKTFSSSCCPDALENHTEEQGNRPRASVQVVDPLLLNVRLVDRHRDSDDLESEDDIEFPQEVLSQLEGPIAVGCRKKVLVTLGLFSIVKVVRTVQLLIPAYDFCIPKKNCCSPPENDPCRYFEGIRFPKDEFFPRQQEQPLARPNRSYDSSSRR